MKQPNLRTWVLRILVVLLAFSPGQALARSPRRSASWSQAGPSCGDAQQVSGDRALGQAMVLEQIANGMPWMGARVNEYVNQLGQKLARSSGAQQAITFRVLYSHEMNAQAFPGGFVFVNSAVITGAEGEAELAFVLAHEIAHLNHCDWRLPARRPSLLALLSGAPASTAAGSGSAGGRPSAPSADTRFSRAREEEADRLAVLYMAQAGYDPTAALRMLDRLEAQVAEAAPGPRDRLSAQPRISARRHGLESLLANLTWAPAVAGDSVDFQEARNEILRYDEVYARLASAPLHSEDPPRLLRRPPEKQP